MVIRVGTGGWWTKRFTWMKNWLLCWNPFLMTTTRSRYRVWMTESVSWVQKLASLRWIYEPKRPRVTTIYGRVDHLWDWCFIISLVKLLSMRYYHICTCPSCGDVLRVCLVCQVHSNNFPSVLCTSLVKSSCFLIIFILPSSRRKALGKPSYTRQISGFW